jgi:hypothetical protein
MFISRWFFVRIFDLLVLIWIGLFNYKSGNFLIKDNAEESLGYIKDFTMSKRMVIWTKNSEKAHIFYSNYEAYLYMFLLGNSGFCKVVDYMKE